jgi:hypothetical protein
VIGFFEEAAVRSFSISFIVGSLIFLVACGSNGTPSGVPVTLSVSANPSTINPGQSSTITATVTNASNTGVTWSIVSPASFGSLSSTTANPTTYTAPASVSKTTPVTIMATSAASSSVTASVQVVVQGATVSLSPAAPQTINIGGTLPISATLTNTGTTSVTWSLSGVGSLSATTGSSITYSAPTSTTGTAKVTATSGSATQNLEITVLASGAGPNVAGLTVGTGPVAYANGVLTSVLVCSPGSTTDCQTVDSVLVDTGSVGLRVLGSEITTVALTPIAYSDGSQMNECVAFLDGSFLWGGVSAADIYIGGEKASGVPVQVIANPTGYSIPSSCSNGGTNEDTQATLGANGIIGVGPEPFDCSLGCDINGGISPPPDMYYASCTSSAGCQPVYASCGEACQDSTPLQQVTNPVIAYANDNNGTIISMTAPAGGAAPTATGTLVFGIGTESNNGLSATTILPLNQSDEFTTSGLGTAPPLQASFIDSGSNGLFFPNEVGLTICTDNSDFYCSTAGPYTVSNISQVSGAAGSATFSVANADTLFANTSNEAFSSLAGPEQATNPPTACSGSPGSLSGDCTFDFGFPFFYGATIYTSIDGQNVPATAPAAPWFAY